MHGPPTGNLELCVPPLLVEQTHSILRSIPLVQLLWAPRACLTELEGHKDLQAYYQEVKLHQQKGWSIHDNNYGRGRKRSTARTDRNRYSGRTDNQRTEILPGISRSGGDDGASHAR